MKPTRPQSRGVPRVEIVMEPEIASPKPRGRPENRRQTWLIRIGLLIPLLLLSITLTHGARENKHLPADLLGVWDTTNGHYADCYMEITPATIVFGNVERGYILYFVSSVEESHEGQQDTYVVHYTDLDGVLYQMSLVHTSKPRETIFLKNQANVVWTRRPSV